jgi:Ala-tRNA(Pro) deacylase
MSTLSAPASLVHELEAAGITYDLIPHARTMTAAAEADVLGVDPHEVAKTIILTTPEGFVRAVVAASDRLDMHKVRKLLDSNHVELASEKALVGAYPEFELGAVPPLTGGHGDRVLVDRRLCERESVVIEAGTHEHSLRMRTDDLLNVADAQLTDICER